MKFTDIALAQAYRDRAAESLMIVLMEGFFMVTIRREAARLEKLGYEVF